MLRPAENSIRAGPRVAYAHLSGGHVVERALGYFETASVRYQTMFGRPPAAYGSPQFAARSRINDKVLAYRLLDTPDGMGVDGVVDYNDGDWADADFMYTSYIWKWRCP